MCEQLVREVKAVWPNAHYLGLLADEGDGDPFWDIETVRDVTGGVLGSYEVENQKFAPFQAIWLLRYADRYEDRFTGDNVPYFDLVNREPLLVEEYEKSIGEVAF
jgi:hypothetical protein